MFCFVYDMRLIGPVPMSKSSEKSSLSLESECVFLQAPACTQISSVGERTPGTFQVRPYPFLIRSYNRTVMWCRTLSLRVLSEAAHRGYAKAELADSLRARVLLQVAVVPQPWKSS